MRINLDEADLAANRQGQLSPRQRALVRAHRRAAVLGTAGLGVLLLLLGSLLLLNALRPASARQGELWLLVPLFLFWVWVLREMPGRWLRANRDLAGEAPAALEGPIEKEVRSGLGLLRPAHHYLYIRGIQFRLPAELQEAFESGRRYRVTYTPHGYTFLGALPLVEAEQT